MFLTNSPQCSVTYPLVSSAVTFARNWAGEEEMNIYWGPTVCRYFLLCCFRFSSRRHLRSVFVPICSEEMRHLWSLICLSHRGPAFKYCSVSPQVCALFYGLFFSGLVSTVMTKGGLCWVPEECIPWKTLVFGVEVMLWDLFVKAVSVLWERRKSAAFSEERWFLEGLSWFEVAAITSLRAWKIRFNYWTTSLYKECHG